MRMIKLYEDFIIDDNLAGFKEIEENLNQIEDDNEKFLQSLSLEEGMGKVALMIGAGIAGLAALRATNQYASKKLKTKAMMKKAKTPEEKEKLKAELDGLKSEEITQIKKVKDKEAQMKKKEQASKEKLGPKEREILKKQKAKLKLQIDKEKAKQHKLADKASKGGLGRI